MDSVLGFFFIIADISPIASSASLKENRDWPVTFKKEGGPMTATIATIGKDGNYRETPLQARMSQIPMNS